MSGRLAEMALYCGQGVGEIKDSPPAEKLVARLWHEAVEAGIESEF
jgi:hypothetical protein